MKNWANKDFLDAQIFKAIQIQIVPADIGDQFEYIE